MNHTITTLRGAMRRLTKQLVFGAALGASSLAHAGVLNFESAAVGTTYTSNAKNQIGDYWIEARNFVNAQPPAQAGEIYSGSNCGVQRCPTNNASNYYGTYADGYLYFGLNNNATFSLTSLDASMIGYAGQTTFPGTSGALLIQGFDASNRAVGNSQTIFMPGQGGALTFNTYDLSPLSQYEFSYVRIYGYACDVGGNCSRTNGRAHIALDNIRTVNGAVPEPATLALFGIGLAGAALIRRRRRAA